MELLERGHFLRILSEYAADAGSGSGRLVLLSGEAGVGKTSLVEAFRDLHPELRWWWGACDSSFTPRPLGPLYEIALDLGGRLVELCTSDGDRRELFAAFLDELGTGRPPTVVVVEDLHWADDATLDWLRYLSRRIAKRRALIIVSYRDDEVAADGSLRGVIGQVATHAASRRMSLPPLSAEAVRQLAGDGTDADELYRLTGGVPFYVTEVLSAAPGEVPRTIADIVTARTARLSAGARLLLEAAAVLCCPADAGLLATVAEVDASTLDECLESGALVGGTAAYRFRHELGRMAVERAIPAHRRDGLHARALSALQASSPPDHARLAYHAEAAGAAEQALRHATIAAREAFALRSNREAATQYRRALRFADRVGAGERAALHERLATALANMDHWQESAAEREQALALRRQLGDPVKISNNLRWWSVCLWRLCRGEESRRAAEEALAVIADTPPSPERAWAHSFYAALLAELQPGAHAMAMPEEALRQAEALGCQDVSANTLNTVGSVRFAMGQDGSADLRRSIEIALEHQLEDHAARDYTNLYQGAVDHMRFAEFDWCFSEGMAYCHNNDLRTFTVCLRGSRATALLRTGRLAETGTLVADTLRETISPVNRLHLLIPLAIARGRQGDPRATGLIDEAWQLAVGADQRYWLLQLSSGLAEAAWLRDDPRTLDDRVLALYERQVDEDYPWLLGELTTWLDRLGVPVRPVAGLPEPYRRELAGDHEAAARWWHQAGCPFEEAVALTCSGRPDALRRGLDLFTSIGAIPAAALVRNLLRRAGHPAAARGPRPATRAHPHGLTPREADVLALLRDGLSNAAISRRLFISERTVHHHVSAVLGKLGVTSRAEIARPIRQAAGNRRRK
jgi:DNA-binding CsgD family transcriptional regulator/tetratricopeptide (TPR) repeat protein